VTLPVLNQPEEGFYKTRDARRDGDKRGVWIPVHFWHGPTPDPDFPCNKMDRAPYWHCLKRGKPILNPLHIFELWAVCAGNKIDRAEYDYLLAQAEHADAYAPDSPYGKPRQTVDLNAIPPIFKAKDSA
jgi:hypothetical protein